MMCCPSWTVSVILFILIQLSASVRGQDQTPFVCPENGNYTSNSTYRSNLNSLLSNLSSNTGFYNASVGRGEDRVNALALCRGDRTLDQCRTCVQTASAGLLQRCPNQKQAIIWYEFCTLLYSNELIYATLATDPGILMRNTGQVPNPDEFVAARTRLFDVVRRQAANGGPLLKVGAGSTNVSASQTLRVLMQCTPDLSQDECDNCLRKAGQDFRSCCETAAGIRMHMPSCNLRYELYPFYNETRLRELQISPSSLPSPPLLSPPAPATEDISTVESVQYDFGKIRDATNDFADPNKLGEGGFGAVYHGSLPTGEEIAVKRLSKDSGQGIAEFKNEVLLMAKLQHRNLVRLLGFSTEGTERLLIYEFVQNASLDKFIFDPIRRSQLDWDKRYKIIGGVAKGLLYLHEDSRLKIIHRDLKASNILLDGDMNPKIADFGMARLFGQDETQRNTSKIVGTYGYMSPEYAMHGQFSIKSDVFSFGVLVMEIITGQRNIYIQSEENVQDLLTIAWKNWEEGTPEKVIDPIILMKNGMSEIVRCFHMGLLCVQENAANRPTMASIVLMLSSSTITLPRPSEPAFYMASRFGPVVPEFNSKDNAAAAASQDSSRNHMSVTDLYPR